MICERFQGLPSHVYIRINSRLQPMPIYVLVHATNGRVLQRCHAWVGIARESCRSIGKATALSYSCTSYADSWILSVFDQLRSMRFLFRNQTNPSNENEPSKAQADFLRCSNNTVTPTLLSQLYQLDRRTEERTFLSSAGSSPGWLSWQSC